MYVCMCLFNVVPAMSWRDLAAATAIGPLMLPAVDSIGFGCSCSCCCCCGNSTSIASASSSARPTNLLLSFLALSTWEQISSTTSAGMAEGGGIGWWPCAGDAPAISAGTLL